MRVCKSYGLAAAVSVLLWAALLLAVLSITGCSAPPRFCDGTSESWAGWHCWDGKPNNGKHWEEL